MEIQKTSNSQSDLEKEEWNWRNQPTQRPHGLQPSRLLHPWDFPGKSSGVGAIAFSVCPESRPQPRSSEGDRQGLPVVMYGCESWTVKKAERRRIDAFEVWCWRRLLRVPWPARRANQSILKARARTRSPSPRAWRPDFPGASSFHL